jgi:UDP-glucose 4-epimerase
MKSFLVTGGFGFLGGRMAVYLQRIGHRIVLGSRQDHAPPAWLPQAEVRQMAWDNAASLTAACQAIDVVIHAAGMDADDCVADPAGAFEMNQMGTSRLVRSASDNGVGRFVFLSTAHVYSSLLGGVITEVTVPTNTHPYAASNLAGERAVLEGDTGMRGLVVRLSNSFGVPAQHGTKCGVLVVNDLCCQAATNGRMSLRTTGTQRRDFIAMSDAIEVIFQLTELPDSLLSGQIFNLGGGWAPTIWEMVQIIQRRCQFILGSVPEIERQEPGVEAGSRFLDFRTDALRHAGISIPRRHIEEIDLLLDNYRTSANCHK